jgi:uncharacterized membrane protein YtjA (UPF0391 family)
MAALPLFETDVSSRYSLAGDHAMFGWAITFLIVALIAAVLGFGSIAGFAIEAAKIVFFVALILFVLSAVFGLISGRRSTMP